MEIVVSLSLIHIYLETGQQMPLHEADALFAKLDAEHQGGGYYDKTDFRIDFTFQGEAHSYSGRQDFGDRDGSLIEHIQMCIRERSQTVRRLFAG